MKYVYIACGVVIVVIISVLITKRMSQPEQNTVENNKSMPTPVVSRPRPTEKIIFPSWKLFTTENFSIQYPPETDLTEVEPAKNPMSGTIEFVADKQDSNNQYSINILAVKLNNMSLSQYAQNAHDGSKVECNWNASISSLQKTMLNNKDAFTFSTTNCKQANQINTQYYLTYRDGIIQLTTLATGNFFQRVIYQNNIKKILSTVRIY